MKVVPIKSFPHDRRGRMAAGQVYDIPDDEANRLMVMRCVRKASPDEYETKVIDRRPVAGPSPSLADGEALLSSASQAAQVSPQTIVKPSANGGKKKGKKRGA